MFNTKINPSTKKCIDNILTDFSFNSIKIDNRYNESPYITCDSIYYKGVSINKSKIEHIYSNKINKCSIPIKHALIIKGIPIFYSDNLIITVETNFISYTVMIYKINSKNVIDKSIKISL